MARTVFVYADLRVVPRELEDRFAGLPWYREVRSRPFVFALAGDSDAPISLDTVEYRRLGTMLDGRPIFCETGVELKEVGCNWYISEVELWYSKAPTEELAQREGERAMEAKAPDAVVLDQRIDRLDPDEATRIAERRARRLVAVKI